MFRTEIFRTATFRTAMMASAAFAATTLLLFGFIYWQTAGLETARIDQFLVHESLAISRQAPREVIADVNTRYARDLHRQSFAAVFTAARTWLGGALENYPADLAADGRPRRVVVVRSDTDTPHVETVRAVARVLADGRLLVVGRTEHDVAQLRTLVLRALLLGLLPALISALCIGVFASWRTVARVQNINSSIGRIMQGRLQERLAEADRGDDALSQLTKSVNLMLGEIERLMDELRGVGDNIAHDLRTPLARLRARLEGGLARAGSLDALQAVVHAAMVDLDQAFTLITALLRIGEIEGSARRAGFALVDIGSIADEVGELYQPVAELKGVALRVTAPPGISVLGDRDLLFEAVVNLVDNAVKFTPSGGLVTLRAWVAAVGAVLSVSDTGAGIPAEERAAALKRFYRADRSRHVPGHGLGLSLVAAIVRLHMFHLWMDDGAPGLIVEIRCWPRDDFTDVLPGQVAAGSLTPEPAASVDRLDAAATGTDSSGS